MADNKKIDYGNGYNDTNSIAIVWCIEDVNKVVEDYDLAIKLTDEECMDVLQRVEDNHDANFGVTWEDIYASINFFFEDEIKLAKQGVANA
tara:strand:- start:1131 stop:1403 length:273 start_codon:yes stop_codon:yes gene_type:complete